MSSHHIVRENQEPALIVASLKGLNAEYLGQLLEWSPSIFASDYTVDFLLSEQIKVDFVVGEKPNDTGFFQEQTRFISPDGSFIDTALNYLIANNYKAVNILTDVIPEGIADFAKAINSVFFVDGVRHVLVHTDYEKWKQQGDLLFVKESALKSLVGVRKVADDTFEVEHDGFIYLAFNTSDFVLVGETI